MAETRVSLIERVRNQHDAVYVNASRVLARIRQECESFHEPLSAP